MNYTHFFCVPFTGLGLHNGFRGSRWLQNRIEVFEKFVVPSLLAQTNKDFIVWVAWRPEEEDNAQVKALYARLRETHLEVVFTFGGILFWDDKYPNEVAAERLLSALRVSLPVLEPLVKTDKVLVTLQPSDDMYLPDIAEHLQNWFSRAESPSAAGYRKGYIMNYQTRELAEYLGTDDRTPEAIKNYPDTLPPFYTLLFSREDFLDPEKHFDLIKGIKSHEDIVKYPNFTSLDSRGFVVGCHGMNISTAYNHPFKGRTLGQQEASDLMFSLGILDVEPVQFKPSLRSRVRTFINWLPFRNVLKWMYGKLPQKLRIL